MRAEKDVQRTQDEETEVHNLLTSFKQEGEFRVCFVLFRELCTCT